MKTVEEIEVENVADVLQNGPRLAYRDTFVVARDPVRKRVLIGGLGCMGVGQMWFDETPEHAEYPGYAEARIENAE